MFLGYALGYEHTQTQWPNLLAAFLMALLFLHSASLIFRQARGELRAESAGLSDKAACSTSEN